MNNHVAVIETGLSTDSYDSIAFKGESTQYLAKIIADITQLSRSGAIYPPAFATWRNPELEYNISSRPHNQYDGRLSPAEAVAVKTMADEGSAIAQNTDKYKLISEVVGDPNGWSYDIVDGMANFGYSLCGAIQIREQIVRGERISTGRINEDSFDRDLRQRFQVPLRLDGMAIKGNTVAAITKFANESVEESIKAEGVKNEEEFQARVKSRRKGIELGAKIYMQVLNIAIQRGMSTTLEKLATIK